jgi:hypothetical protein
MGAFHDRQARRSQQDPAFFLSTDTGAQRLMGEKS